MNRTKIEWTDYSWNPITGCKHGCWYCYAKKLCQRFKKIFPNGFEPTFYPERLKEPYELKKPSKIFVCSIADLYATWTPSEWRQEVLDSMLWCPVKHTFQLLTKNPELIPNAPIYPDNWWFGTTVTGGKNWNPNLGMTDQNNIDQIKKVNAKIRFVSFEPLLGSVDFCNHCLEGIQWVIVGKLTGSKKVKLQWDWVADIIQECKKHNIPLFMKNNLVDAFPTLKDNLIQEFPREEE